MQFLTQTIVALLLLWNVSVSRSASTEKRSGDFSMSGPAVGSPAGDEDASEELNARSMSPSSILPGGAGATAGSRSRTSGRRLLGADDKDTRGDESLLTRAALNYGTIGYLPTEGIFLEFPMDEQSLPAGPAVAAAEQSLESRKFGTSSDEGNLIPLEEEYGQGDNTHRLEFLRAQIQNSLRNRHHVAAEGRRTSPWSRSSGSKYPTHYYSAGSQSNVIAPTLFRTAKRSPGCLRKCMAQGFLHPSQCHSLC